MNNRSENTNLASFEEHSRAESWDSNDRLETESSAANIYAQGGLSRLQTYAANQVTGKKVTATWRAALAVRDAALISCNLFVLSVHQIYRKPLQSSVNISFMPIASMQ